LGIELAYQWTGVEQPNIPTRRDYSMSLERVEGRPAVRVALAILGSALGGNALALLTLRGAGMLPASRWTPSRSISVSRGFAWTVGETSILWTAN